jgi:hypothetical protein
MFVVYYCESNDRYSVSRLESAKRLGLEILSVHNTYRQAEIAAVKLSRKNEGFDIWWAKKKK